MTFVVSRDQEDGSRQFFDRIADDGGVWIQDMIFYAFHFDTREEAQECADLLNEHGMEGMKVSEVLEVGHVQ